LRLRTGGARVRIALVAALCFAGSACGSRIPHDRVVAAVRPLADAGAARGIPSATVPDAAPSGEPAALNSPGAAGAGTAAAPGAPAPVTGGFQSSGAVATPTGGAAATSGGSNTAPAKAVTTTRPSGHPTAPATPAAPGTPVAKAPLVIGNVSTRAGVIGGQFVMGVETIQAWVANVNAHGGLGGRSLKLISADDGNDSARHQALVKDMVENRGVIAFVGNFAPFSMSKATTTYLEQKRVPVVGGDLVFDIWWESAMLFPSSAHARFLAWTELVNGARFAKGKKKLGTLVCREVPQCSGWARYTWDDGYGKAAGFEPVYRGESSLAQPDFTAECLQAQRAGVEVLLLQTDSASVVRTVKACAQQNFKPLYLLGHTCSIRTAADTNGAMEGSVCETYGFPYTFTGSPGSQEFATVLDGAGVEKHPTSSSAWASAKLFERAAAGVVDPPTSEQLIQHLLAIRGDTLGGLAPPLTFADGRQPGTKTAEPCTFLLIAQGTKWVAVDGDRPTCSAPPA
jgi:branched-chain amino acid transport system substrate-binding protein